MAGEMDNYKEIIKIFGKIFELRREAYVKYKLVVDDICGRASKEEEIEHLLDSLLDFCGNEDVLKLYKKVCRYYCDKYPQMIANYVYCYRDLYDNHE